MGTHRSFYRLPGAHLGWRCPTGVSATLTFLGLLLALLLPAIPGEASTLTGIDPTSIIAVTEVTPNTSTSTTAFTLTGTFDLTTPDANGKCGSASVSGQYCTFVRVNNSKDFYYPNLPGGASGGITSLSATQIVVNIPNSLFLHAGTVLVKVVTQPTGATPNLTVSVNNPTPTLDPGQTLTYQAGSPTQFSFYVSGSGFTNDSLIYWNHAPLPGTATTPSLTGTKPAGCPHLPCLGISVPPSYFPNPGTVVITAVNPDPNGAGAGGESATAAILTLTNPIPNPATVSPSSVTKGASDTQLRITGGSFVSGAYVKFGSDYYCPGTAGVPAAGATNYVCPASGMSNAVSFQDASTLKVTIAGSEFETTRANVPITIYNPDPGGGPSAALTSFSVIESTPAISSTTPSAAVAGSSGVTMTVTGSSFDPSAIVTWDGVDLTSTTWNNYGSLTATIPGANLATPGTHKVGVRNPAKGTQSAGTITFVVQNPVPTVTSFDIPSVLVGSPPPTITINGTGFVSGSTVNWGGQTKSGTSLQWLSGGQIQVTLTAADVATAQSVSVSVTNPTPGGGTSNSATFTVANPSPTVTILSPTTALAGSTGVTVMVTGANFVSGGVLTGSSITWNGSSLTSTVSGGGTTLTAMIPSASLKNAGTATIGVSTVGPGGGTAGSLLFIIAQPVTIATTPLQAAGSSVTTQVSWAGGAPTSGSVTCGQGAVLTVLPDVCTYAAPGTYTITGTYVLNGQSFTAPSVPITVPAVAGSLTAFSPTVNAHAATGTVQVYSLPARFSLGLTLTLPSTPGVPDLLDLNRSRVVIAPTGQPAQSLPLTAVSNDGVTYLYALATPDGTAALNSAGAYTVTLSGYTLTGQAVGTSQTFTLNSTAITLTKHDPQGKGVVTVQIEWPSDLAASNLSIDCGTTPPQTSTGTSATCLYTKSGSYTVVGRFTDAMGTPNVPTAPLTVDVPWQALTVTPITYTINGKTDLLVYSLPANLAIALMFAPADGVGVYDPLDAANAKMILSQTGQTPRTLALANTQDLSYTTSASLTAPGTYTLMLNARTQSGQAVSTSPVTFTLSLSPVTLSVGAPSWTETTQAVSVPVQWPTTPVTTNQIVECGTTPAQKRTGASVRCEYGAAGTYTISGTFTDATGTPNVPAGTSTLSIPALPLQLDPAQPFVAIVDGVAATAPLTVYSTPVPVTFPISFQKVGTVGFADTVDLASSSIQVTRNGIPAPALSLSKQDGLTFQAQTSLTASGTYTFTLLAKTTGGQSLHADASVTLTVNTLALTLEPVAQKDPSASVAVGVHWPASPTVANRTVDCGTTPLQTLDGDGQCVYTKSGSFTITGRYTDPRGVANVATAPATVTVRPLSPGTMPLVPLINGQPAASVHVYTFPTPVSLPVTLTQPEGIGILDELNLGSSAIAMTKDGVSAGSLTLTRIDGLHYTASASLTASGTYTFTLLGLTGSGATVTTTGSLVLTLTPVTLTAGVAEQRVGWTVAVPITWPADPVVTEMVADCGTSPTQTVTGPTGTCLYTQAGSYTVTGRFTDPVGAPNTATAPLTVTIPALALNQPALVPMLGNQPLAGRTLYTLPQTIGLPVTFTAADGVGVPDSLNLGTSKMVVTKDGTQIARLTATRTDALHYTASFSPSGFGAYVFTLDGHTQRGSSLTTSVALPLTLATITLQADPPVQDGANVSVPIHWPADAPSADATTDCGTRPAQGFSGLTGECTYAKAGSATVTGAFTDPNGSRRVATAPLTVSVASVPVTVKEITIALNGQPANRATVSTTLPAVLDATVTLAPPAVVGIVDPIFGQTSVLTITRPQMAAITVTLTLSADGLTLTGQTLLNAPGDYHVAFSGRTQGNVALSGAVDTSLSGAPISLQVGALAQTGPRTILVPLTFPEELPASKYLVDCGTHPAQMLAGQSVTCTYTAPGTYQVVGYFTPQGSQTRTQTEPSEVVIPAQVPPYLDLAVQFLNAGYSSEPNDSRPDARKYHLTPTIYPVDVRVTIVVPGLDAEGVGVPSAFDEGSAKLTLTLTGTADGQAMVNGPSTTLPLHYDATSNTFIVQTSLRGFLLDGVTPHISGQYSLVFTGTLQDGTPVTQSASLLIDEPLLQAVAFLYGIDGPYAPTTYRYRLTELQSPVKRERITISWTAVSLADPSAPPIKSTRGSTNFAVTFTQPGTYRVSLAVLGTVSGSFAWSEDITVQAPPTDAPYITISSGGAQRPPVQYLLKYTVPPGALDARDRVTTSTWIADGIALHWPPNRATVTQPGTHTFALTVKTAAGKELTASQTVDVAENMVPRGTIDCTKTQVGTASATLRCSANGLDPDGSVKIRRWVVPELKVDVRQGWSLKVPVNSPPETATVHLYATDNSGATLDLGPVTVPLRPQN